MRWKLFRRRLSISAPRMIVRSHLPWPLRWAIYALALGFSAALALWAFEFGRSIAGLDRGDKEALKRLRVEIELVRDERDKARAVANSADSRLLSERTAQDKLTQQLKQVQADNAALKEELRFFDHVLPSNANAGLSVRALQAQSGKSGQIKMQMLLMQSGREAAEFKGAYQVTLAGTLNGQAWSTVMPPKPISMKRNLRLDIPLPVPLPAVVKTLHVKVLDEQGVERASGQTKL